MYILIYMCACTYILSFTPAAALSCPTMGVCVCAYVCLYICVFACVHVCVCTYILTSVHVVSVVQYVAVCCSVVQCVAVCCSVLTSMHDVFLFTPAAMPSYPTMGIHVCTYVRVYVCTFNRTYICVYLLYVCKCVCFYSCMYIVVNVYVFIHVCI